jgi:hypothetical protein
MACHDLKRGKVMAIISANTKKMTNKGSTADTTALSNDDEDDDEEEV